MATLVRVYPEQINEVYTLVEEAISGTMRTPTRAKINNVLKYIMVRTYQCWSVMEGDEVHAIAITGVIDNFGERHFLLHTFYVYKQLVGEQYVELWEQLKKLAQTAKCEDVIFYTSNEKLCEFVTRHGGLVEKFVSIPI